MGLLYKTEVVTLPSGKKLLPLATQVLLAKLTFAAKMDPMKLEALGVAATLAS